MGIVARALELEPLLVEVTPPSRERLTDGCWLVVETKAACTNWRRFAMLSSSRRSVWGLQKGGEGAAPLEVRSMAVKGSLRPRIMSKV